MLMTATDSRNAVEGVRELIARAWDRITTDDDPEAGRCVAELVHEALDRLDRFPHLLGPAAVVDSGNLDEFAKAIRRTVLESAQWSWDEIDLPNGDKRHQRHLKGMPDVIVLACKHDDGELPLQVTGTAYLDGFPIGWKAELTDAWIDDFDGEEIIHAAYELR